MMARATRFTSVESHSGSLTSSSVNQALPHDSAGFDPTSKQTPQMVPGRTTRARGEIETPPAIEALKGMGA